MRYNERNKNKSLWKIAGIGTLAFVFGVAGLPASAQQSQGNLPGYPVASGQQAQNSTNDVPQESNPAPAPALHKWRLRKIGYRASERGARKSTVTFRIDAACGNIVQVRTNEWISTSRNLPGDGFNATLAQPIVVNGWVVAQRGQSVLGRVTMVQKNHGTTQLGRAVERADLRGWPAIAHPNAASAILCRKRPRSQRGRRGKHHSHWSRNWRNRRRRPRRGGGSGDWSDCGAWCDYYAW
jgi:hypothetical protein